MTRPTDRPTNAGSARRPRWSTRRTLSAAAVGAAGVIVIVATLVAVFSGLLARGDRSLSARIVVAINQSVGTDSTRLDVERVSGTLLRGLVLERPRLVLITPDGEVTWASARRVRIGYDLASILFSRSRSFTAAIDSPVVRFVHDRSGRLIFPKFASRGDRRSEGPATRVSITLRGGSFSPAWEGIRFSEVRGRALLTSATGRTTIAIQELSGLPDSTARAGGRLRAMGSVVIAGPSLTVDPLHVLYGESRAAARLVWDLAKGRVADGALTAAPVRLADALRFVNEEGVDGRLVGTARFTGLPTDGRATAFLSGEIAGERVDTLTVDATFAPRVLRVTRGRLRVGQAEVSGTGSSVAGGPIEATLRFRGVDPSTLPWWKEPEAMPRGSLAGTATIRARRARPKSSLSAVVAFTESRLGRYSIHRGFIRVERAPDGSAVIDSSWAQVPGASLSGAARVAIDQTVEARVIATIHDLARFAPVVAPIEATSGRGRMIADFSGPLAAPSFTARADLTRGRLANGLGYDSLRVDASGTLGASGRARADVVARRLSLDARPLGDAVATLSIADRIVIERYEQARGDSTLSLQGSVDLVPGGANAVLDSVRLEAGALRARNLEPVRLTIGGGHVRAAALALDLAPGRLDADVDFDLERKRIDARGSVAGLDVSRLAGGDGPRRIRGELRGQFLVAGPMADPDVSLRGEVLRPTMGGVAGDSLVLALEYAPGVLRIERARWVAAESEVEVAGSVRAPVSLEGWLRALGRKDERWAHGATLALDGRVRSFDLARLAVVDTSLRTLAGTASLDARVTGSAASPVIELTGRSPRFSYQSLEGTASGIELRYAERVLRIVRLDVATGGSVSSITGEVPIDLSLFAGERLLRDEPLRLTVRIPEGDFKAAAVLSPHIAASGGRVSIMANVSGTPRRPMIEGTIRLSDGMVRVAGRDEVVRDIDLEGTFDQDKLTIARMTGRQGSVGRLSGSGTWQWGGLSSDADLPVVSGPRGQYQFSVQANDFTVTDRETYLFQLTGSFKVNSARTARGQLIPRITGAAALEKGNLTLDLNGDRDPPPVLFYYDVTVEVPGGLYYRTVDSEVELEGTLRLMNEGEGRLALGTMSVKKGRYYFLTREIENLSGEFIFNSVDRIDPELAVDGETRIQGDDRDRVIKVSLTGRASRPIVHLWDPDPNQRLTQEELWQKFTFGQFAPGEERGSEAGSGAADLAVPVQEYLFRNAERWLSESGWIDTIDLRTGARSGSDATRGGALDLGVVGAGKYVTSDLYVNYSRDFSPQGEERIGAEYRVTRHLLLKGEHARNPQAAARGGPDKEYNLDLKIRLEY